MARAKSAVLSAADKKAVLAGIKANLKTAKDSFKAVVNAEKATVKEFTAKSKEFLKDRTAHSKTIAKLEAELAAITGPKAS